MSEVKIQKIPPGVTNNPDNGILEGEVIKSKWVVDAINTLDDTPEVRYKKAKPYCTCLQCIRNAEAKKDNPKKIKKVNHKRYELTEVDRDENCVHCGYPAHFYCIHPQSANRMGSVKRSV